MSNWSDERIATLSKLWLDGVSAGQIAKQLGGVSRNAIIGKVGRLGLKRTPERSREIAAGHAARAQAQRRPAAPVAPRADSWPTPARTQIVVPLPPERPHDAPVVPMERLTSRSCRYPIGDPADAGFGFCGAPKPPDPDIPYCAKHRTIAFNGHGKGGAAKDYERSLRRFV